tara:strand:- start:838 stop:1395 length:558 start_codon:yes stop_codon:yes gene_type:complete
MLPSPIQGRVRIVQRFGERPEVYSQFGLAGHNGIDMTGEFRGVSVPILSPIEGTVTTMQNDGTKGYGRYLRIVTNSLDEKGRYKELTFAHLASYATGLKLGQIVYCGDKIGMMGGAAGMDGAGFSSGMHLHFGLRFLDKKKQVLNYNNGFKGSVDFLQYILFLQDQAMMSQFVTYPYGKTVQPII